MAASHNEILRGGDKTSFVLPQHHALTLTAGGSRTAVALFVFRAGRTSERYCMPDTLKAQHTAFLTTGRVLLSDMGRVLLAVTEDTCGWHDPLTGASNAKIVTGKCGELNYQTARNAWHRDAHSGFLRELGKYGLGERDLTMNVNFFQKVTADATGGLTYHAGNSQAGAFVDLRAEMNTLVVLNTAIHPLDTSPTYSPKPVHLAVWSSPAPGPDDFCRKSRPENERGFVLTERYFL